MAVQSAVGHIRIHGGINRHKTHRFYTSRLGTPYNWMCEPDFQLTLRYCELKGFEREGSENRVLRYRASQELREADKALQDVAVLQDSLFAYGDLRSRLRGIMTSSSHKMIFKFPTSPCAIPSRFCLTLDSRGASHKGSCRALQH
jgi:hypothetical protein